MATVILNFEEMRSAIKDDRLTITTGKEITKGTTPNNNIHHAFALTRANGTGTENFNFTFPNLVFSHITRQVPGDSKYASYFIHGDIYGKWPIGKNRGEDPKGDSVFDFFTELEQTYVKRLTDDSETRSMIFLHTSQEPVGRDGKKVPVKNILDLINPIISYPVHRDGHPQAKERDDSKSPTFKIKMWDAKITDANKGKIRKDSLLVNVDPLADPNGNPKDVSRYLQIMYTKIYDLRKDVMSNRYITTETELNQFVYSAGDSAKGKPQCTLLASVTVLAPSWYWEAKKGASLQFKAVSLEIYKKINLRRTTERTNESKILKYQEALLAIREYGLDEVEDEDEDEYEGEEEKNKEEREDDNRRIFPREDHIEGYGEYSPPRQTQPYPPLRQMQPNATISTNNRPRTISCAVYTKKSTVNAEGELLQQQQQEQESDTNVYEESQTYLPENGEEELIFDNEWKENNEDIDSPYTKKRPRHQKSSDITPPAKRARTNYGVRDAPIPKKVFTSLPETHK